MREVKNIPRLRFPEFEKEWLNYSFDSVSTFYNGRAYKQNELLDKGEYPVLRVGNLFTNNEWYYSNLELDENKYIDHEDLIYAWSASFGPRIWYGEKVIYHYHIWKVVIDETIVNKRFYFQILENETIKMKTSSSNGFALLHITKGTIENWKSFFPSLPEQQKIADFLTAVDKRIELLEKKKTLLETYKKGVMKKIFNQEIRFKDDNGNYFPDWEERRLEDVFKSSKGKGLSKDKISDQGAYKSILYGELYTTYKEVANEIKSFTDFNEGTLSQVGDLLVPCSTTTTNIDLANVTAILEDNIRLGGDITILRSKGLKIDNIFYSYYLSNHKKFELAKFGQGTTIVHLYFSHFNKMRIDVPSYVEQTKISDFLTSIDKQVDLLETLIDKSKTWKKGLLQKMFV